MLRGTCDCSSPWSHSSISAGTRPPTYGRAIPTRADPAPDVYNLTIAKSDILKVQRARPDETFGRVLREAVEAVDRAGYRVLVLGGLAPPLVGLPRRTHA